MSPVARATALDPLFRSSAPIRCHISCCASCTTGQFSGRCWTLHRRSKFLALLYYQLLDFLSPRSKTLHRSFERGAEIAGPNRTTETSSVRAISLEGGKELKYERVECRVSAKTRERNYEQIYREWPAENKHRAAANPPLFSPPFVMIPVVEARASGVGRNRRDGRVWQHIITVISGQVIN